MCRGSRGASGAAHTLTMPTPAVLTKVWPRTAGTTEPERSRSQVKTGRTSTQLITMAGTDTYQGRPGYCPPINRVGRCHSAKAAPVTTYAHTRRAPPPSRARRGKR